MIINPTLVDGVITGYISQADIVDSVGDVLDAKEMEKMAAQFMLDYRAGQVTIDLNHGGRMGRDVYADRDVADVLFSDIEAVEGANVRWKMQFKLRKQKQYIEENGVTGFSFFMRSFDRVPLADGVNALTNVKLGEVSILSGLVPANSGAQPIATKAKPFSIINKENKMDLIKKIDELVTTLKGLVDGDAMKGETALTEIKTTLASVLEVLQGVKQFATDMAALKGMELEKVKADVAKLLAFEPQLASLNDLKAQLATLEETKKTLAQVSADTLKATETMKANLEAAGKTTPPAGEGGTGGQETEEQKQARLKAEREEQSKPQSPVGHLERFKKLRGQ